jgi:hypothetical protein
MSIAADRFAADRLFPTYEAHAPSPFASPTPAVLCPRCGYEVPPAAPTPAACPRCSGGTFERYARFPDDKPTYRPAKGNRVPRRRVRPR